MVNAREMVLKGLYRIETEGAYTNQVLKELLSGDDISFVDRGFVTELLTGVVRTGLRLDYVIERFSKIKLKKLSPWVHQILRMGIYQILFLERVPDSAACNESVKLANRYANGGARGFVNGLLRTVVREKENIPLPKELPNRLSVEYSCPLWLTEKLLQQYGEDVTQKILSASLAKQPVSLRVNRLATTAEELQKELSDEGICTSLDAENSNRLFVEGAIDVNRSKSYKKGLYSVQNSSSMTAVEVLDPQCGDLVLDLCAAPGGKTAYIAERMGNKGSVSAFDLHPHKMELIQKTSERLGITIVSTAVQDATELMDEWVGKADRVLADVPCSGIGVIHKKPDIKWHRTIEDVKELCEIQKKILRNAASYLKEGGVLVYSTCTILKEENQEQVQAFLKENPEFEMVEERNLFTHETGGSGFYIAKLIRKG